MPFDYDYTYRVDERELEEIRSEQTYRSCLGWIPDQLDHALTRYERRLGRPLDPDEGKILMHALTVDAPKNTSRFVKCEECGEWIDRGKLGARFDFTTYLCDYCGIPF